MPSQKRNLRAVEPDEQPPKVTKKKVLTVAEAARSGNHRDLLEALRDRVAEQVADVNCPPRDLAALTRRLQEIAKELDAIDAAQKQEDAENAEVPDEELDASAF